MCSSSSVRVVKRVARANSAQTEWAAIKTFEQTVYGECMPTPDDWGDTIITYTIYTNVIMVRVHLKIFILCILYDIKWSIDARPFIGRQFFASCFVLWCSSFNIPTMYKYKPWEHIMPSRHHTYIHSMPRTRSHTHTTHTHWAQCRQTGGQMPQ